MTAALSKYAIAYRGPGKASSFGRFREEVGRKVQHLDIEPHVDDEIEITTNVVEVPGVLTMQGATTARVSFRRTPELLRDGANGVVVVCPSPDPFRLKIGGGDGVLAPNYVGVWDQARVGEMENAPGSPKTLIHVCRQALARSNRNLESKLATIAFRPTQMANLLLSYAGQIVGNRDALTAAESAMLGQHVVDIVSLILGADGDDARLAQSRGVRAAILERIKAHVLANHTKPDYAISDVTARFKISERSIQMLFEGSGQTFSDYVAEQRLLTAWRQLNDPNAAARKVIDIAHASGFGDLSYFHRRFRRRFGTTPAGLRRDARS